MTNNKFLKSEKNLFSYLLLKLWSDLDKASNFKEFVTKEMDKKKDYLEGKKGKFLGQNFNSSENYTLDSTWLDCVLGSPQYWWWCSNNNKAKGRASLQVTNSLKNFFGADF